MAAAPIEMSDSFIEPTETIIHSIMDLLSLPYSVTVGGGEELEASPFYLLHCLVNEMRPRKNRDAIFEILRDDPSLKEDEHYRTLRGYHPPLIGLHLESLDPAQRAILLTKLAVHASISNTPKYLGDRVKGDRKSAFLPLKATDSRFHFITYIVRGALEAAQFRLNTMQIDKIIAELERHFNLSLRREAIKKTLKTTTIQTRFSQSLPARYARQHPIKEKRGALFKPKNQDAFIGPQTLTGLPHAEHTVFTGAFVTITQFVQKALARLCDGCGSPFQKSGTTAVGGVIHHDPTGQVTVLSHFNLGDSKMYLFPGVSAEIATVFATREHTIYTDTEITGEYFLVGPQFAKSDVELAIQNAAGHAVLRVILEKCLPYNEEGQFQMPTPDSERQYPFDLSRLTFAERRTFFTAILPCPSDFHVYCACRPANEAHAIAPTRIIGDLEMGDKIGRTPTVGHIELPADKDVWIIVMSDGVSEILTEGKIKKYLHDAIQQRQDPANYLCDQAERAWFRAYPTQCSDDITAVAYYVRANAPLKAPVMLGVYDGHGKEGDFFSQWTARAFSILVPALLQLHAEKRCRFELETCEVIAAQLLSKMDLKAWHLLTEALQAIDLTPKASSIAADGSGAGGGGADPCTFQHLQRRHAAGASSTLAAAAAGT